MGSLYAALHVNPRIRHTRDCNLAVKRREYCERSADSRNKCIEERLGRLKQPRARFSDVSSDG